MTGVAATTSSSMVNGRAIRMPRRRRRLTAPSVEVCMATVGAPPPARQRAWQVGHQVVVRWSMDREVSRSPQDLQGCPDRP